MPIFWDLAGYFGLSLMLAVMFAVIVAAGEVIRGNHYGP